MASPVAYLRRSKVDDRRPGIVSHEAQLAAVRELAGADADRLLILEDWGRSGRAARQHLRPAYARLRAMIEAGEVSALYSYSLSRLARSTRELLDLAEHCEAHRVPIRLAKEGDIRPGSAIGRLYLTVLSAVSTYEAEVAGERATDAIAVRRARGDRLGRPAYGEKAGESSEAVVAAFAEAGSFLGACKLLNSRGIRSRLGNGWNVRTVARIVRRERPGLVPAQSRQGARARSTRMFGGLLVCSCGAILTSMPRAGSVGYYCRRAHHDPAHPRPYVVSERKLLAWAIDEAGRLRVPDTVEIEQERQAGRERLDARRARILDMYEAGDIDRDEYQRRIAGVKAELDRLAAQEAATAVLAVPQAIDWQGWAPERINAVLRALWRYVELDAAMRPVRAEWTVPEWRA